MKKFISSYSYKEHSDAATDEDDVIETANTAVPEIPDDAECIEKVLTHRLGWPGGISSKNFTLLTNKQHDFAHGILNSCYRTRIIGSSLCLVRGGAIYLTLI